MSTAVAETSTSTPAPPPSTTTHTSTTIRPRIIFTSFNRNQPINIMVLEKMVIFEHIGFNCFFLVDPA